MFKSFCGQISFLAKRGVVLGLVLIAAWIVAAHGFALWRYAPEGGAAWWRFHVVTFALWLAPGLCWFRWGVKNCASFLDHIVGVIVGSVTSSGMLIWVLYFFGLYTSPVAWIVILILTVLGLVVFPWRAVLNIPARLCRFSDFCSWSDLAVFAVIALFGLAIWIQATGAPLTSWDAIISWDKWACDMAERWGLGNYSMGGYPQLLPSLCSVSYKLAGSWGTGFSDDQLLMHGYAAPFAILFLLAVILLCRAWEVPWAPCILMCVSIGSLQVWWISGYVDIPSTALIVSVMALLTSLMRGTLVMRNRYVTVAWIGVMLFGVGFIKGYGLMWVILIPLLAVAMARRSREEPFAGWKSLAAGVAVACLFLSSFYVHQRLLTTHGERVDANPRLHTFSLQVDKSALYDRSPKAAKARFVEALDEMGSPCVRPEGRLARKFKRGILGIGIVAGALPGGAPLLGCAVALHWWVWEKTTAYDWRNALPALVMFCLLFSLGWRRIGGRFGSMIGVIVAAVIAWPWLMREAPELIKLVGSVGSRRSVGIWAAPVDQRLRSVAPHQFFMQVILEQSPLGKRAHYVYAPDELYRHLGSRGVYTLKGNAFSDLQSGDLLICNSNAPAPEVFTPIATLRFPGYEKLLCLRPAFHVASWSIVQSEGLTLVSGPVGESVSGQGWLKLKIDSLIAAGSGDSIILAIQFKSPSEAAVCSVELPEAWDTLTNIRSRVCPVTDGAWIRTLIWLDRGEGVVPSNLFDRSILVKVNSKVPVTIVGIQVECMRDSPGSTSYSPSPKFEPRNIRQPAPQPTN